MRVIISTTKGKNDRMALAATENAKVWTSVCVRYLTVASNSPAFRRGRRWTAGEAGGATRRTEGMGGLTAKINPTRDQRLRHRQPETKGLGGGYRPFLYL